MATALALASALVACAGGGAAAPEGLVTASGFPLGDESFARYRRRTERWLRARSMPQRSDADIALNLPFERVAAAGVPYRGRFLLLHGLNDSPAVWHDFADELVARGFDVRAILFAGHGSTPEDMLDVRAESWLSAARFWLDDWLEDSPETPLYLGGFSMGGVVATYLALERDAVDGLLLVSPAYYSRLERLLRFAGVYKLFEPWVFGGMILEDNPIKYNSIPVNSGWQFHRLTRMLARRWRPSDRIDVPALLVLSTEDSVVDVGRVIELFRRRFTDARRQLVLYAPDGEKAGGLAAEVASRAHEETRDSRVPEHRILGQSHLSLTNAPSNALFGEAGSVLVCNGNEYPVFMACMRASDHWYGAQHTPSPDGVPVARTTWNPDWAHVLGRFDEIFVDGVDAAEAGAGTAAVVARRPLAPKRQGVR